MAKIIKKIGLIGWPVQHSISPGMHNSAFQMLGLDDWHYELCPIAPNDFNRKIAILKNQGFVGANITIPYKTDVMHLCSQISPQAKAIGAINTVDFVKSYADNTDITGFIDDLRFHHLEIEGQNILILGAGGAARAAAYGMEQEGASVFTINRTISRAHQIAKTIDLQVISFATIQELSFYLIVNCTSLGMWPHIDCSPWPQQIPFPSQSVAYDMVYRPKMTKFLQQAQQAGARTIGGVGMLVRQACQSFQLWTGRKAPMKIMLQAAQDQLYRQSC